MVLSNVYFFSLYSIAKSLPQGYKAMGPTRGLSDWFQLPATLRLDVSLYFIDHMTHFQEKVSKWR